MKQQAIIRLIVLVIVLLNQTLVVLNINPLPWSEEEIYGGVSSLVTFAVAAWTWYKNNNITKEAQDAQELLEYFKEENNQ